MGTIDMFWTPPATTMSCTPDLTAIAAKLTACWPDPHWRSTVTPGTASGRPAASQQVRAMSPALGPTLSRLPKITSSTAMGSTSVRCSSALMAAAPRSAGCTSASPPPRRPVGVRTASTMYASLIADPPSGVCPFDYAAPAGHVNSPMTWAPINSMVCMTLSWGTLYGLKRQNTMSQPVAS